MASFTTAQKRDVIQRHYPTANNIAVKGNVFFAVFPDAEPVIGWLHSPCETLWVKAAVPVSACPALRTVPPCWFIDAAKPYMQGDERKKWYLYTLIAAQQVFQAGKTVDREIMIDETNLLYKETGGCCYFQISGNEKEFRAKRADNKTVKTIKKADLLYALTDEPARINYRVDYR